MNKNKEVLTSRDKEFYDDDREMNTLSIEYDDVRLPVTYYTWTNDARKAECEFWEKCQKELIMPDGYDKTHSRERYVLRNKGEIIDVAVYSIGHYTRRDRKDK